jgi:DEAD/DEAH box helicase domain-containing protein
MGRDAQAQGQVTCPNCGSPGWADLGQKRSLLKLTQVSARSDHLRSQTSDDTDERERRRYLLKDFIDIRPENWGGGQADQEGSFGFEYLKQVTLREINFGPQDGGGRTFTAAGEPVPEEGFTVCADCGVVRPPQPAAPVRHRQWCYFNQQGRQQDWRPLFLYRQVESEAIRLLLPVSTFQAEAKLATFKAGLELGLRRKFKGDPGHLIIREQQDPGTGGDRAPRRFLVLYDTVPGGTGYLKEFARRPQAMRDVLEGAFRTLKSCRCRQQPGVDGCYRCVYAYQRQAELELVSRELGIEMLGEILSRWDRLRPVQFLSQVQLPDVLVESELEGRFLTTLEAHQKRHQRPWSKLLRSGKWCFELQAEGGKPWLLEPQVDLGASEGVPVPCRPDFVLWPQGEQPAALPVAVFTDGFAFHVKPAGALGGLADDVRKRLGLVRSGRFVVWSLTWDDVDEFTKDEGLPGVGLLLDLGIDRNRLRAVLTRAKSPWTEGFMAWSGLESLLRYLARPEPEQWRRAVAAALLVSTLPPAGVNQIQKYPAAALQALAERLRSDVTVDGVELPPAGATGSHLAKLYDHQSLVALANAPVEAANKLEAGSFAAILRIEDRQAQRQAEGFKGRWRKGLQAANLWQFLPGFEWVSAQAIETQAPAPVPAPQAAKPAEEGPLAELLTYCDPRCHDLLRAAVARGCAVPEIGFELQDEQGRVCAEAELAWPDRQVAVVLPERMPAAQAFRERGWTVFGLDASPTEIPC